MDNNKPNSAEPNLFRRLVQRKFVRDTVIIQFGETFNLGAAFITSVLLARMLEPAGYGVYALIYSLFGMLTITGDLGIAPATITQLAESFTHKQLDRSTELCGYFVKLTAVLSLGLMAVGTLVGPWLASVFYDNALIGVLAVVLVGDMFVGLPRHLARVVWQSSRQMSLWTSFEIGRVLVKLTLVIGLLAGGLGVTGAIVAEVMASLIASIAAWPMMARLAKVEPEVYPSWRAIMAQAVKVPLSKHFAFGFKIVLDRNIIRIVEAAPFLILGAVVNTATVGYLRVAWGAINLAMNLLQALARNLAVRLPQLRAKGDVRAFWRIYAQASLAGGGISMVTVGVLCLAAPLLVEKVYGVEFMPAVAYIYVMSLAACLSGFFLGLGALYRAVNRMGLIVTANAAQLVVLLPVCWLLIQWYGGLGGAWFIALRVLTMNMVGQVVAMVMLRPR